MLDMNRKDYCGLVEEVAFKNFTFTNDCIHALQERNTQDTTSYLPASKASTTGTTEKTNGQEQGATVL